MQFYAILNDNKSIKEYSTTQLENYIPVTINDNVADALATMYNMIWVDEDGFAHTENLPITEQTKQLNNEKQELTDIKSSIEQDKQTINDTVSKAQSEVANLQQTIVQMQQANVEATAKISQMQQMMMRLQQASIKTSEPAPSNNVTDATTQTK